MEYKIIDAVDKSILEQLVNEQLEEWKPSGGICCVYDQESSQFFFFQAMLKRNSELPRQD